ncbi:hypothetical protein SHL15_6271 [Streptomyces hygroscopicus subsp. limoneus]|nr:hypothetical protein SHL15_6271 [Streptomyces hygroscopicus subsp. limoneus]
MGEEKAEGGVLQGDHQPADDGGQHGTHRLRDEDMRHDLGLMRAERERGLAQAAFDGVHTRAEDLGEASTEPLRRASPATGAGSGCAFSATKRKPCASARC